MIDIFMKSPAANSLGVIVLIALIVTWLTSIVLSLQDNPVRTDRGWYAGLLPAFSILGIPAAWDLLQTKGATFFFAAMVLIVFVLNLLMPVLRISGKTSHALVTDWYKWSILISTIGGLVVAGLADLIG